MFSRRPALDAVGDALVGDAKCKAGLSIKEALKMVCGER